MVTAVLDRFGLKKRTINLCIISGGEDVVNKYICRSCGRFSYSAASPQTALNDRCPYPFCEGHVILTELTHNKTKAHREEERQIGVENCIIELKQVRGQHGKNKGEIVHFKAGLFPTMYKMLLQSQR